MKKQNLKNIVNVLFVVGIAITAFLLVRQDFSTLLLHLLFGFMAAQMTLFREGKRYNYTDFGFVLRCTLSGVATFVSVLMANMVIIVPEKALDSDDKK